MIKYIFFTVLTITLVLTACSESNLEKSTEIVFKDGQSFNFGKIEEGGDGTHEFKFTNKGENALLIKNVKSSCGCTVPTYPKDPIEKGKSGTVKVKYNTKRIGAFVKHVTVYSNAKVSPVKLEIKGEVVKK